MITLKTITMKNFLSVGNVVQAVNLDTKDITLVLGENLDLGGNDNRNGCGKTTILNALSYALFGEPLTKIKMNNLINKTNGKNMVVSVTFDCNGDGYFIERGRKPDTFVLMKNQSSSDEVSESNEAQGESRVTQEEINEILGFNHLMFKHIVALNTYTVPFLSSTAGDQREIIETLLGVLALSSKAENLKSKIKDTKQLIKDEETAIATIKTYNDMVLKNVTSLIAKHDKWEEDKKLKLDKLTADIERLTSIDIKAELQTHDMIEAAASIRANYNNISKDLSRTQAAIKSKNSTLEQYVAKCSSILSSKKCPECEQELHIDHGDLLARYENEMEELINAINTLTTEATEYQKLLDDITLPSDNLTTIYKTKKEALVHNHNIDTMLNMAADTLASVNPYQNQINDMNAEVKEPDYSTIDVLNSLKDHQEFLLKLLTNKDSFIRKKIITQNIAFLNSRLSHYLIKVGLQHNVVFMADLEVEITYLGKDLDFDNLSRGERTRLILALSWAFRDVYEGLNASINVMFVDELIDTGLDPQGVESSLSILKDMVRSSHKSIFLISHRDELIGRVDTTLKVIKENGFTSFEY